MNLAVSPEIAASDVLVDRVLKFLFWLEGRRPSLDGSLEFRKLHELGLYYDEDYCIRALDS